MTADDKKFLYGFELGEPDWNVIEFKGFKDYPSVRWKMVNLQKLKRQNPAKIEAEADKLREIFGL